MGLSEAKVSREWQQRRCWPPLASVVGDVVVDRWGDGVC